MKAYEELNLVLAKMGRRVLSSAEYELPEDTMPATWTEFECETALANFPLGTSKAKCEEEAAKFRAINKEAVDGDLGTQALRSVAEEPRRRIALTVPSRPARTTSIVRSGSIINRTSGNRVRRAHA